MNKALLKLAGYELLVAGFLLCAVPAAAQPAGEEKPVKAGSTYRLNLAIHEFDDGKKVNTRNYGALMEDGGQCRIRAGARVPIPATTGTQYMDVGTNVDFNLTERDGMAAMRIVLDLTGFAQDQEGKERPLLRNIRAEVHTTIPLGKPTTVSSVDDPTSKRRFELEVTATKLK